MLKFKLVLALLLCLAAYLAVTPAGLLAEDTAAAQCLAFCGAENCTGWCANSYSNPPYYCNCQTGETCCNNPTNDPCASLTEE